MAHVEGLTKARMLEIEAACVVDGEVVGDNLHLVQHDGTVIDAGSVRGPQGDPGTNATNKYLAHVVGEAYFWPGTLATVPVGSILAGGQIVNITDYPELFTKYGTLYGGNGTTTFGVPNMLGRVPVGYDSSQTEFNAIGKTGGSKTHTHPLSDNGAAQVMLGAVTSNQMQLRRIATAAAWTSNFGWTPSAVAPTNPAASQSVGAALTGATDAGSTLMPYISGLWVIKALYTSGEIDPNTSTHAHAIADVTGLQTKLTSLDSDISAINAKIPADGWTTTTVKTGYQDYGTLVSDTTFKLPRFRAANGFGQLISGWVARSSTASIAAGTAYVDSLFDVLPVGYRPDSVVVGVGQLNILGAFQTVQFRILPTGVFTWVATASGSWTAVSGSYMILPNLIWRLA